MKCDGLRREVDSLSVGGPREHLIGTGRVYRPDGYSA